ncbi:hypothetical protein [Rhizohabitans arisaemae]|uniref:hypothetical protein n=1 Tax=Rhizohabitans arisaemae TaxID=2720610 RepID=UPI0024B1B9AE|nr:hypothetical protein [Rhizohabitans arisaemae]
MTPHPRVVVLNLRGKSPTAAVEATYALFDDESQPDLTRLLVVDGAADLPAHERAYEVLLTSARVETLLCVPVGRSSLDGRRFRVPGVVGQGARVIWVGDAAGVDWRFAASAAATMHRNEGESGLHRLLGVLTITEVFERACEILAETPGGVASPGLRLVGASADDVTFLTALGEAIGRLLGPGAADSAAPTDSFDEYKHGYQGSATLIDQGGPLKSAEAACTATAAQADAALEQLADLGSLLGAGPGGSSARGAVAAAGDGLAEYRNLVERVLDAGHTPDGLTPRQRDLLKGYGVSLPEPVRIDPSMSAETFDRFVTASMARGESLPGLVESLRALERQVRPMGSRSYLQRVREICPDRLIDRLRSPAPAPGLPSWLPVAGFLTTALASVAGLLGVVTGVVMGIAWMALVTLSVVRAPDPDVSGNRRMFGGHVVAVVLGLPSGVLAGINTEPPVVVVLVCFLIAVGIAVGAVHEAWRTRVIRWRHSSGVAEVPGAAERLTALVGQVASDEWARVSLRLDMVDAIIRARAAIAGVVAELGSRAEDIQEQLQRVAHGTGGDSGLSPVATGYLKDLVHRVLEPRWGAVTLGKAAKHEELARSETRRLLGVWTSYAESNGPLDAPPFAEPVENGYLGQSDEDLDEIAAATGCDVRGVMWQLSAPADLSMLDTGAVRPGTLRFAPRAVRLALGRRLPADVTWISAPHAGCVRLVPVRLGAVQRVWSTANDDQGEPVP